ncbi:MAG: nucleoside-diphosphate sugar epimerase/dehydratase, partial [Armatimonadota bacterium]|nr:nucleoside-diphosphate sugar epimerase/dehydratase [Armatimonadota bacterium]
MKTLPVLRIRYAVVTDIFCIVLAFVLSFLLRYDAPGTALAAMGEYLPLLWASVLIRMPTYALLGLYHRLWRYASTRELLSIITAGTLSSAILYLLTRGVFPLFALPPGPPTGVLALDWLLNLAFLSGTRLALRIAQEQVSLRQRRASGVFIAAPRRVLVVGAGDTAAMLIREMHNNPGLGLFPVAAVDDDKTKVGMRVHDVHVMGQTKDIPRIVRALGVEEVLIAVPNAPGSTIRAIKQLCQESHVSYRTVPSLLEVLDGKITARALREVKIEDLLRRDPVVTDQKAVAECVGGRCVLVTGAGGSIGSELCRQLARHNPERLLLLGHGEYSIYNIHRELAKLFPNLNTVPLIADVRDTVRIRRLMNRYTPALVFHAAAHKHVPLMEVNVEEAITNNILGTRCVLDAAADAGVERFVMISTDKAVNPSSVMGATKRVAELLVQEASARTGRPYVAVRFGNVLGSRGSAVPLFQEQIAAGGPVTVTHPEMRRFFMTIPEAVHLVLQAFAMGEGGEAFVLNMGEQVR